jgi:hypothetical protein
VTAKRLSNSSVRRKRPGERSVKPKKPSGATLLKGKIRIWQGFNGDLSHHHFRRWPPANLAY